ncbi:hypothetical protein E2C01_052853 [Portunus trituberculatus]|uniref:Secreted protein n=1 Tax=Portunus trituberculatus TaxID=210409 RepID=A0A5B7GMU3_PORTR|nr:hypothetical protein [Portunus trituberculatus]
MTGNQALSTSIHSIIPSSLQSVLSHRLILFLLVLTTTPSHTQPDGKHDRIRRTKTVRNKIIKENRRRTGRPARPGRETGAPPGLCLGSARSLAPKISHQFSISPTQFLFIFSHFTV